MLHVRRVQLVAISLVFLLFGNYLASTAIAQSVTFRHATANVGDVSRQQIRCGLVANQSIQQQNQLVDTTKHRLDREQSRTLTILAVNSGKPVRARLQYGISESKIDRPDRPSSTIQQPVANKAYFVIKTAQGLEFADEKGNPPSEEERVILERNLAAFGKPNPLAQFLHNRTVTMGESLDVPAPVAQQLLGLAGNTTSQTGTIRIKLTDISKLDGSPCAVFETFLRTSGDGEDSVNMLMQGHLAIEIESCRTREIQLNGPVATSELRGPATGRFRVTTHGDLSLAVKAQFNHIR